MVPPLALVPTAVVLLLLAPLGLATVSRRADLLVSRVALALFGRRVAARGSRRESQVHRIRAARVDAVHRVYAARTLLVSAAVGIAAGVAGGAVAVAALERLPSASVRPPSGVVPPTVARRLLDPGPAGLVALALLCGVVLALGAGGGTYWLRWRLLDQRARARATEIEATLPRTVGFVYALSRSGMAFPKVLAILTRNRAVYGAAADEIGVAVRDVDAFGTDVTSALQRMSEHTPSEGLDEFADNLASVLASGRSLTDFLREQHERYRTEARSRQEQYVELLAAFAEIYVTVLVAGPLFVVTVLVVIGLVLRDTLLLVRLIGYLGLPVATAAFVVYLDRVTETLPDQGGLIDRGDRVGVGDRDPRATVDVRRVDDGSPVADGGVAATDTRANRERLDVYDRLRRVERWLDAPVRTILDHPRLTVAVTVPVALLWILSRADSVPLGPWAAAALDEPLVEGGMLVLGGYALVYELRKRRARAVDRAVPDFLARMASLNEAGLPVVESLKRVNRADLGALGPEVERAGTDVEWGADANTALRRLADRTRTVAVSQAVTLVTNAMWTSGNVAPVLRIAAEEAQENRRLRRERRQEMLAYLLVVYIAFLVFLGIVTALAVSFIPAIEATHAEAAAGLDAGGPSGAAVPTDLFGRVSGVDTDAYRTLFFHLAAVQGVCSGLVAGQLGEGSVRDGAKHAAIMLTVAYVTFLFV